MELRTTSSCSLKDWKGGYLEAARSLLIFTYISVRGMSY